MQWFVNHLKSVFIENVFTFIMYHYYYYLKY